MARRPSGAITKVAPGANRILSGMVADALAEAQKSETGQVMLEQNKLLNWHLNAANEGVSESLFWLGTNFIHGNQGPPDYIEAYKWLWLAAEQGSEEAFEHFYDEDESGNSVESDFFDEKLSAEQIQQAHRRIGEFVSKHWNFGNIFGAGGCTMFFTDFGRVYMKRSQEITEPNRPAIDNFPNLKPSDTKIISVIQVSAGMSQVLFFCTRSGQVKKSDLNEFSGQSKWGSLAISLDLSDTLIGVKLTRESLIENEVVKIQGDDIVLVSKCGMSIRFNESDVRSMGRSAHGVRGIKLNPKDDVIGLFVVTDAMLLIADEKGKVRLLPFEKFRTQSRGGEGVRIAENLIRLVGALTVEIHDCVTCVTKSGQIISKRVSDFSGDKPINLMHGDKLVSIRSAPNTVD